MLFMKTVNLDQVGKIQLFTIILDLHMDRQVGRLCRQADYRHSSGLPTFRQADGQEGRQPCVMQIHAHIKVIFI